MPSRARLMASSATRWVRWRTKVKAHVLALICPSHRMLLGLWVAIGALVASAPGVQAEEGRALHVTDDTARRRDVAYWQCAPKARIISGGNDGCYTPTSRARLMALSATRWVRWRIKVKAH